MNKNSVNSIFKNLNRIIKLQINNKSYWTTLKKTRLQIINNFSIEKMSENIKEMDFLSEDNFYMHKVNNI